MKSQQSFALDGLSYSDVIGSNTIKAVCDAAYDKCCKTMAKDIMTGKKSVPSYKSDMPIMLKKPQVRIQQDSSELFVNLAPMSSVFNKTHGMKNGGLKFKIVNPDGSQKAILNRLLNGTYRLCDGCQISYDNKKWFLSLCFSFEPEQHPLDREKVLGVDLGIKKVLVASSFGRNGFFEIDGSEINHFYHIRNRKIHKLKQARYESSGSVGHGTKRRTEAAYADGNYIANYQKTLNHKYSRKLVDYAIKNHFGVIQMEDLSGIKQHNGTFLQHWTYYDLQEKIESKCKQAGIEFVKIAPRYTSQRCSRCGCIHEENRPSQAEFKCIECGHEANADFNASQNISIPYIDQIISQWLASHEPDKKEIKPKQPRGSKTSVSVKKTVSVKPMEIQCSMFD